MGEKAILARQQELLDLAKSQNRDLSPEEKREWDDLQGKLEELRSKSQDPDADPDQQRQTPPEGGADPHINK